MTVLNMKSKRLGLSNLQADLLAMKLQEEELLGAVQQSMNVRKVLMKLDYRDHRPMLSLSMPGGVFMPWKLMNTRTRVMANLIPADPDLALFVEDLTARLTKIGARLTLVHQKDPKSQRKLVKMVVISGDSKLIQLSLIGVYKGGACTYDGVTATELKS
ncbi:hypothetical protein DLP3_087 [Stenotrophomonas phage vB_SmaS_DLP_3]|nr:hypothetical protein DLP3_087 [Stenotrophomonas phage vB_SmaS_DLP_3]